MMPSAAIGPVVPMLATRPAPTPSTASAATLVARLVNRIAEQRHRQRGAGPDDDAVLRGEPGERRAVARAEAAQESWAEKAELALSKGREDLATAALVERARPAWAERSAVPG